MKRVITLVCLLTVLVFSWFSANLVIRSFAVMNQAEKNENAYAKRLKEFDDQHKAYLLHLQSKLKGRFPEMGVEIEAIFSEKVELTHVETK